MGRLESLEQRSITTQGNIQIKVEKTKRYGWLIDYIIAVRLVTQTTAAVHEKACWEQGKGFGEARLWLMGLVLPGRAKKQGRLLQLQVGVVTPPSLF